MLQFYDLTCKEGHVSWSLNTLKDRYLLNYKNVPFETVWLKYIQVADNHKKIGIKPNRPDEALWEYTCGAIKDGDVALQNGHNIATYLEEKYPEPSIFPHPDSRAKSDAAEAQFKAANAASVAKILLPRMPAFLDEGSDTYFYEDRSKRFGVPLERLTGDETEALKLVEQHFGKLATLWDETPGRFLTGDTPVWADFVLAGLIGWAEKVYPVVLQKLLDISPHYQTLYAEICKKYEGTYE